MPTRRCLVSEGIAPEIVRDVLNKITFSEYKRRQAAPGLKVSPRAFGMGRRVPIACRGSGFSSWVMQAMGMTSLILNWEMTIETKHSEKKSGLQVYLPDLTARRKESASREPGHQYLRLSGEKDLMSNMAFARIWVDPRAERM